MGELGLELFIKEFKKACVSGNYYFVNRKKNLDFIMQIGWTVEDVVNYLYENLSPLHLFKGPEPDNNPNYDSGIVYIFKMPFEHLLVYVKIKKKTEANYFIILSFHEERGE
ncbi:MULTISPECIES: hypothetical protein [unclassified Thermosipho (in: thermotogales)]|uniref:hypothetical protein n=1 Tax=unclassified Thermosipho (in: thermotogales) TaxID=2676525 RepID=UPI0009856B25|nr:MULTISPECIES: hypothetical protein [unclassified Thermosipho (in: thermotogales)]MBT1247336.1 hypothetical protein [Thermosipho sp. 1244]OOC46936.1 hypothetical protein XO09_04050 [Thermosipho sp. 1223]